jgi:hypothetical protein
MLARGESERDTAGDERGPVRTGRCRKEKEKKKGCNWAKRRPGPIQERIS